MSSVYERAPLSKSRFRICSLSGDEMALRTLKPRALCGVDVVCWVSRLV